MRVSRFILAGVLGLVVAGCACGRKACAPRDEFEPGFVSLFNGETLDNWVVMGKAAGWKVRDGVIHSGGGRGGEWLRSVKQYGDFILRLEWKVSRGGNSGVFIRCKETGSPWDTGHEIQISNEQPPRDDLHCTGSLYGSVAVNPRPDETPNRWRQYEITCRGKRITVKVDGVTCVDAEMDKVPAIADKPLRGYLGVQDSHTGIGKFVEYRNIRIKEL